MAVIELDQEIEVAAAGVEIIACGRAEQIEPPHVKSTAERLQFVPMLGDFVDHGPSMHHSRPSMPNGGLEGALQRRLMGPSEVPMSPDSAVASSTRPDRLYAALAEPILDRDQKGASEVYYDLVRAGRPLPEMLREAVRIHGPYTHVPYHERMDDGYVNFVNNDHCLLSARSSLHLSRMLPGAASGLPMAQP